MTDRDRWDDLFDEAETFDPYAGLAESFKFEGHTTTVESCDGFVRVREVRVTEPWRPSLVRRDERPRVKASTSRKRCAHCGTMFSGINRARYCGTDDCTRSRATSRKAASRA